MYGIASEKDIGVDSVAVTSVTSSIMEVYDELLEKIKDLKTKRDEVADYWNCQEAGNFVQKMNEVTNYFDEFSTHYGQFIEALKKICVLYDEQEDSILEAVNNYAGIKNSL